MLEVDGGQRSGSGTILRLSVAFSAVTSQPLHIFNIREKRPQPGLKPQHLQAVLTSANLCDAKLDGAALGSRELWFTPNAIKGGDFGAEIGTAGSIPMLLLTVLPICAYAMKPVRLQIAKGGTDTWSAPTINYLRFVLLPILRRMGLSVQLSVQKYGYYPKGMGEATLIVDPCHELKTFRQTEFGNITSIKGYSVCTYLADKQVGQRQADAAIAEFAKSGLNVSVEVINDFSNPLQKGSSIVLWAETDTGVVLAADAIGELGKPSETVGKEAAMRLLDEIKAKPTVDVHMADLLIPYTALADEASVFTTRKTTNHLLTNVWLTEKLLASKFDIKFINGLFRVAKVG